MFSSPRVHWPIECGKVLLDMTGFVLSSLLYCPASIVNIKSVKINYDEVKVIYFQKVEQCMPKSDSSCRSLYVHLISLYHQPESPIKWTLIGTASRQMWQISLLLS